MRLNQPFLKLPRSFCAETLHEEVKALPASAWIPHPDKTPGNDAVPLVTVGGEINNAFAGQMKRTEHLLACKYVMEIMSDIGAVWGRSRFMRVAGGAKVTPHVDINYYWRTHLRIHIPVVTSPNVLFTCGDETVHMAAGECWTFDNFRRHTVVNDGSHHRVHLVLDTVGGDELWDLMEAARNPAEAHARYLAPGQAKLGDLKLERVNAPKIMSPWEIRCHIAFAYENLEKGSQGKRIFRRLEKFADAWGAAWARFGESEEGLPAYGALRSAVIEDLKVFDSEGLHLTNGIRLTDVLDHTIFRVLLPAEPSGTPASQAQASPSADDMRVEPAPRVPAVGKFRKLLDRPVFIVSTPRSGSTLLFETLRQAKDAFTTGGENHGLIEGMRRFHPASSGWSSNRLTEADAVPAAVEELSRRFYQSLSDRDQAKAEGPARMLEKTPKNCLRVPFLANAYPDATFVYLYRDARQTFSSMLEAWRSARFRTYADLPSWQGLPWSLLLVPGWRDLIGKRLPEIVAHQWTAASEILLKDLSALPRNKVRVISYEEFLASPQENISRLCASLDLDWDRDLGSSLPLSRTTVSAPNPEKWRVNEHLLTPVWPLMEPIDRLAQEFVASFTREPLGVH